VSPNTPLLSTEVQQNAWVCGEPRALDSADDGSSTHGVPRQPAHAAACTELSAMLLPQVTTAAGSWACRATPASCTRSRSRCVLWWWC
jgi:hypothetical protein